MITRLLVVIVMVGLVSCERLSPEEAKLVGSWEARTAPDSVTTFTFEPNHRDWCVVRFREDTWIDGTGRWHVNGNEIVFDDVTYPAVAPDVAAKDPKLAKRPKHYTASFEQIGRDTIKFSDVTLTRTTRPAKPMKPAPFSP